MSVAAGSRTLTNQLVIVIQNQANSQADSQLGAAMEMLNNSGLAETLSNTLNNYARAQESQAGHWEVHTPIGVARIFIPQQMRATVAAKSTDGAAQQANPDEHVLQTGVPQGMEMAQSSLQAATATLAAALGRDLVFNSAHEMPASREGTQLSQSATPSRTGDTPENRPGRLPSSTSDTPTPTRTSAGTTAGSPLILTLPTANLERVPAQVRELLTQLQLLPPGTQSADVLPKLQEVVRLWSQAASAAKDLPPDVVRVVNHFLASAVLSMAMADPKSQTASLRQETVLSQRFEGQASPSNALFSNAPMQMPQVSGSRIADAVMNLLSGNPTPPPQQPLGDRVPQQMMPQARPDAQPLPQQAQRPPSLGPSANLNTTGLRADSVAARTEVLPRTDGMGRSIVREETREPHVIVRTDAHGTEEKAIPSEVLSQGTYERDAHKGQGEPIEGALEAIWPALRQDLHVADFIDMRNGSIRALRNAEEGRALLSIIALRVPERFDLVDVLGLITQKIGWSEKSSPVNDAFARLAGYRNIADGTKAAALLEPLRDTIMVLGMNAGLPGQTLSDEETHVLRRFEAHLPAVEMFLEPQHDTWFDRLENQTSEARSILESEIEEARALYVDYLARQNGMRNLFNTPETPRLLN